ncbi:VWA domain-containing protein [Actinomadura spongiicola]|uniref:VWA domain-containing protein n=1 Tax=Actinomadura spongiicola TaxID=2303421 RepID=A0A372GB60_9ACTN|nr:VWA domain-containing protein [Actinomadura spongiicola]RFS82323.1 VWA domain-containing protein [Actinomadura spongiicola]
MDTPTFLAHLQTHDTPLTLPRGGALRWDDADLHRAVHARDAEEYALLGLAPGARPWQRARVLLQILAASQAGLDERARAVPARAVPARAVPARVVRVLTLGLPPAHVITVLLALRRLRANHKHTTRAVLRFVLEHPHADALIAARRPALLDCFEHALGTTTARGCARRIDAGDTASDYLRRRLLRFLTAPTAAASARVRALYTPDPANNPAHDPAAPAAVPASVDGHATTVLDRPVLPVDTPRPHPPTVTVTDRGDIAATLVHLYRDGPTEDLYVALCRHVGAAAAAFPRFEGTLALVLDASASMRGHGDREWAPLSQAAALRMVLSQVCARLEVIEVGGDERAPRGATDLATGVLDALGTDPDLVAVVSDGYENLFPGDLARVVAALPRAGVTTPVVFCHVMFTGGDDLRLRRPAPSLPQRGFWHQDDFAELLPWMFAHCPAGAPWLRAALHARLDALDRQADDLTPGLAA